MKTLSFPILALLAAFFVSSCQQKPGGSDAEVGAAQEVDQLSAQAVNYPLDTEASELTWYGFKPTGRHNGTIAIQDGTLAVENGQVVGGSFTMDLNTIDVLDLEGEDKQKLTGHLQSPDFFDVAQHPTAKFEITEVVPFAEAKMEADTSRLDVVVNDEAVSEYAIENPTHAITGNLTMRDTTLSIMFPAKVSVSGDQIMAQAKFNIDRTKWNVSYGDENDMEARAMDKFIYNTVNVGFDIKANKEAEATASTL